MFEKLNPIDMDMKSSGMGLFPWYGTIIDDDDGCSDDAAKLANMSNFDVPSDGLEVAPPP